MNHSDFINEVEKFSKSRLKRKAELIRIYEEAVKNNNQKLFDELVFTAKYVQGLLRIVKGGNFDPGVNNIDQIKKDFSDNMDKVVVKLKEIISGADDNMKLHFEQTFFELSRQGFINMSELMADLEWVKIYQNDRKRNSI